MHRLRVVIFAAVTLIGGTVIACAGPCTAQIAQVERSIRRTTPGSVESAEIKAREAAEAALDSARNADAAGDAGACKRALEDAKELYGLE